MLSKHDLIDLLDILSKEYEETNRFVIDSFLTPISETKTTKIYYTNNPLVNTLHLMLTWNILVSRMTFYRWETIIKNAPTTEND